MASLKEKALLVALIERMCEKGSWCGETHIQKTVYFGRELFGLPINIEFILYKHGPFSFELRDELDVMQAEGLLRQEVQPHPYGPTLAPGPLAKTLKDQFPKTIGQYRARIAFLGENVANRRAAELERIATALFVTRQLRGRGSPRDRAKALTEVKPHISIYVYSRLRLQMEAALHASRRE
ncbi:MAG: hypothetical protein ACREU7_08870 [Burkholderiales bacterium]